MADPEVDAMGQVAKALDELDDEARVRVLAWASAKFGAGEVIGGRASGRGGNAGSDGDDEGASSNVRPGDFGHISDLYDAANPSTGMDRALVGGYWFQYLEGNDSFGSQAVNTALKDLGHGISNITKELTRLQKESPRLVIQVKKRGTSRQARKEYKLTTAGKRKVEAMVRAPEA